MVQNTKIHSYGYIQQVIESKLRVEATISTRFPGRLTDFPDVENRKRPNKKPNEFIVELGRSGRSGRLSLVSQREEITHVFLRVFIRVRNTSGTSGRPGMTQTTISKHSRIERHPCNESRI